MYKNELEYYHKLDIRHIDIQFSKDEPNVVLSKSMAKYLQQMKDMINENESKWSQIKSYTNAYEYVHTPYENKIAISTIQPVSRSFYKLIELNKAFDLKLGNTKYMRSMHLAEGPGGFIEAMYYLKGIQEKSNDLCIGVSLQSMDSTVPSWKRLRDKFKDEKTLILDSLHDGTGNLYNPNNFGYIFNKYKNSMHFITADGGFDFSKNYNSQEHEITKLLISQVMYAIICQRRYGTFIMKMFDIFTMASIDILYLLGMYYEKVYISKPFTSRVANSEKYIVCKNFKYSNTVNVYKTFETILIKMSINMNSNLYIHRFLNIDYNHIVLNRLEHINSIIGQKQIENIVMTLMLIYNTNRDIVDQYKRIHIHKCVQWFIDHDIRHHSIQKSNIFTSKSYNWGESKINTNTRFSKNILQYDTRKDKCIETDSERILDNEVDNTRLNEI